MSHWVLTTAKLFVMLTSLFCVQCFALETKFQSLIPLSSNPDNSTTLTKDLNFGGLELSFLTTDTYLKTQSFSSTVTETVFRPQISLFASSSRKRPLGFNQQNLSASNSQKEYNRYKNTIPAIYRVTLKGYSIMEYSNYKTDTWSLNKVNDKAFRKPEIMFSVSKSF